MRSDWGMFVQKFAVDRGLSYDDIATALTADGYKISRQAVEKWINQGRSPRLKRFVTRAVCRYFGLETARYYALAGHDVPIHTPEIERLARKLYALDDGERVRLVAIFEQIVEQT